MIEGNRPSITLMAELGLQLVQKATWEQILAIHEEKAEGDINLDQWQDYFSKHLTNLFTLAEKIRNYQVQAEFFKKLLLIQQKGRQILISFKKIDEEIATLLHQGKLDYCSDRCFISPIVIRLKKDSSVKLALEARELNQQVHKNKYQYGTNG